MTQYVYYNGSNHAFVKKLTARLDELSLYFHVDESDGVYTVFVNTEIVGGLEKLRKQIDMAKYYGIHPIASGGDE